MTNTSIFWFRRDLRLFDNAGLYHALKQSHSVQPIFIFDTNILDKLEDKDDARVQFIHDTLVGIDKELQSYGCRLHVYHGEPAVVWKNIVAKHKISSVYTNRDYEPYALERDTSVAELLSKDDILFNTYKDQIIFEKDEVLKGDGGPYTVFSPYKRRWLERVDSKRDAKGLSYYYKSYPTLKYAESFAQSKRARLLSLKDIGFEESEISIPSTKVPQKIVKLYDTQRNFPGIKGTTTLGIHFRFGTISIREKARKAEKLNQVYLSELVWRDFYSQILSHFPHVVENAFRAKYEKLEFRNNEEEFEAWCEGRTGYPIVDAGMRELNATGYMHNRVRMVVASFLTKHLLIDWRWGEAYFARKLLDFDLASNNGGWQWASGSGTDAAPYFRIFNPTSQMTKFDKDLKYIKKWVPEYGTDDYPEPIVDHKMARERCLAMYKACLPSS